MPPRRACDVCYKRKIQCVIETPGEPCDWCSSQKLSCTFDRVIQKDPNKRTTTDVVQELSTRVEQLEEALRAVQTSATPDGGASTYSGSVTGPPSIRTRSSLRITPVSTPTIQAEPCYKLSRCELGNNWYFKGVGIFSLRGRQWISEGAGQRVFLESFDIFGNPNGSLSHVGPSIPDRSRRLPPMATCRLYLGVFLDSKTSILFPILERSLFEETIVRAYDASAPDAQRRAAAQACVWAMLAMASRTEDARHFDSSLDPEACAQEVRRLLNAIDGATSLDSLEATLLLWAYQKMRGQCREAYNGFANATRMLCELGGHFLLTGLAILPQHIPMLDDTSRTHIRGLFWLCYCFDKDIALRTQSPPLLTSEFCDVTGPRECPNQTREIELAKIRENAVRLLCSPRAFKYTEGELLSYVRQLDDELEEWRLSVEPRYRPRLSIPIGSSLATIPGIDAEDRTHAIKLQLEYLSTMINIHTLVRKCGDYERSLPDDLHSVVESSADLSIEASRSIYRFLETAVGFWKEDSMWIVSHYAPLAAMPLFMNILIHPLGSPADNDLQILASVGNIARHVLAERLSGEEVDHIQGVVEFVMELVRLCHSAAWLAKKGERAMDLDIIHHEGEKEG